MNFPITGSLSHQRFTDGPIGLDSMPAWPVWGDPVYVDSYGWWQPSPDQILGVSPGRRANEIHLAVLVPQGTICGDRDKWIVGGVTFEQVAGAQDYSHGPFSASVPLVVYLKNVEG